MSEKRLNRRRLLGQALLGTVAIGIVGEDSEAVAAKLSAADPLAARLGYIEDASKVDAKRFATYKSGQTCANCVSIKLRYGFWRPCKLFPNYVVSAKGWCSAWAPQTYQ
ncbi:MAG: high-potential iron-sulfur protein [Steroidobacteraceae bacterium]